MNCKLRASGMVDGTSATTGYTLSEKMEELVLTCDTGSVTFTIKDNSWTVNAGEAFDEAIAGAPFTEIDFVATGDFRFYGRG